MIDAYEIGIQLLLQEDVTAGLAVINRGLGEVDRAIAATSASLAGLVHEAERAAKAVAVAVGGRAPQLDGGGPKSAASTTAESNPPVKEDAPTTLTVAPTNVVKQAGDAPPIAPSGTKPEGDRQPTQAPATSGTVERVSEATAPTRPAGNGGELLAGRGSAPSADQSDTSPVARVETVVASSEAPLRRDAPAATSGDAQKRHAPDTPRSMVAITAAVGQSQATLSSVSTREQVRLQEKSQPSSRRERMTAAPWPTTDQAAPSIPARSAERAAAPQSPGRERTDGGGGTVMLDGRLVGQWLSEHMAREASRPPGGTSFFDARQTPAWNVSGAL